MFIIFINLYQQYIILLKNIARKRSLEDTHHKDNIICNNKKNFRSFYHLQSTFYTICRINNSNKLPALYNSINNK